jgi:hypothetical protein
MKLFTTIFRRKQRLDRPRKRPGRGLAVALAPLESRALLTIVGPIAMTPASVVIAPLSQPAVPNLPVASSSFLNFGNSSQGQSNWNRPDTDSGSGSGSSNGAPFDRLRNHVAVSAVQVSVDGSSTTEVALADAGKSGVVVRIGNEVDILGQAQGIDHPQSVLLAYLDNNDNSDDDPYPDLIVVNSGSDNVLVFPGLAGGQFGPAINGTQGFAVGEDPVSVSVADVNDDGVPDLLVANQASDTVTILEGQSTGSSWTSNTVETIKVGNQDTNTAPVKALYEDVNDDGVGDILVCNSGSNNVYDFSGLGHGAFNVTDPIITSVDDDPIDMLVGRFDRRSQLDLVTVNAGSNDLTLVNGVFTSDPTTQTISSGGLMPDAAFAFSPGPGTPNGMMDLIVANSGDGRLAFLQGGNSGLQIAGIITPSDLPIPTSLAPGLSSSNGIEFIAATAGQDAADLLRFDLNVGSTFLTTPVGESSPAGSADGELVAGLMPYGDSSLELIAVFWAGSPDQAALDEESNLREPSSITALYTPTEGQGNTSPTPTADVTGEDREPPTGPAPADKTDPPSVNQFVTGVVQKIQEPGEPIEALAARDALPIDRVSSTDRIVGLDDSTTVTPIDPDRESTQGMIGEVLHHQWLQDHTRLQDGGPSIDPPASLDPSRRLDGVDTSAAEGQSSAVPLASTVALFSARLILRASPPQPPSFSRRGGVRVARGKPESGPRT